MPKSMVFAENKATFSFVINIKLRFYRMFFGRWFIYYFPQNSSFLAFYSLILLFSKTISESNRDSFSFNLPFEKQKKIKPNLPK